MNLIQATDQHLTELMSWFSNEEELSIWSGPNCQFPFDVTSFKHDIKFESLKSFVLMSNEDKLLGFGQYYLRLGKCHLGRLVVHPQCRGQGIISHLIQALSGVGQADLNVDSYSLFVLAHNQSAMKAYTKLGFSIADYPEAMPLENCLYMVKN